MAELSPETRLVDALYAEERLLDRLVAFDKSFAKFSGVLNDERVATTLRLADVARMLGLSPATLLAVVQGQEPPASDAAGGTESLAEGWIAADGSQRTLDVRPLFERGEEPLATILDEVAGLDGDTTLIVEAPFHPLPLRRLLRGWGFKSFARQLSPEHWQVAFRRTAPEMASQDKG